MTHNLFLSLLLLSSVSLFSQEVLNTAQADKRSDIKLQALLVNGACFSPEDGVDISVAKAEIIAELKKEGVKGANNSAVKLIEITTKASWKNMGVQIYLVRVEKLWVDGVAILKNRKVLTMLMGVPTGAVFLADLDQDGMYEVYINYFFGSGMITEQISGYNVSLNENYSLSMRLDNNVHLNVDNGILMAEIRPCGKHDDAPIIKEVVLKKTDQNYKLTLE